MIKKQDFPDPVTTHLGRPWLWMAKPGAWLADPVAFRQLGVGQFMFGLAGQSLLLLFPGQSFVDLNIDICQAGSRIRSMSALELERFMKDSGLRHCTLAARMAVWVPYGWVPMCIASLASPGAAMATHAILPYINSDMIWMSRASMRPVLASLDSYESGFEGAVGRALERDLEAVKLYLSEALEGDCEESDSASVTTAAAGHKAVTGNLRPVRVVLPPPSKKRHQAQGGEAEAAPRPGPQKGLFELVMEHARTMPKLFKEDLARRNLPPTYEDSSPEKDKASSKAVSSSAAVGN